MSGWNARRSHCWGWLGVAASAAIVRGAKARITSPVANVNLPRIDTRLPIMCLPFPVALHLSCSKAASCLPPFHAVFISGLPKLPCANPCRLLHGRVVGYNVFRVKCLALKPESEFWHLTCSRTVGIGRFLVPEFCAFRCASRHRILLVLGDAIRNHATRPFRRAGVEPRNRSPKLEEVFYEQPYARYFASGRDACISGLCANFVYPRSVQSARPHRKPPSPRTT